MPLDLIVSSARPASHPHYALARLAFTPSRVRHVATHFHRSI